MENVLSLQPAWVAKGASEDMQLRGLYVRSDIPAFIEERVEEIADRLLCAPEDVEIEGKDATGSFSRVPWVRVANRRLSPNPRTGWYVVYLFAEDGSEVALSLNQGTQIWDGVGLRSQPEPLIRAKSSWARGVLADAIAERPRLDGAIELGVGNKARAYEAGNAVAYRYAREEIPSEGDLVADLLDIVRLLQAVYRAEARMPAPGEPAPEIVDAERSAQELAGRRVPARAGFRVNAKQRKAIELRAMALASEYYANLGGTLKDVSASQPFDLEVQLDGAVLTVEVKGTAGEGAEVLLTRGEVRHHQQAHPHNALVIVSAIRLDGPSDAPEATGGELTVVSPWTLDDAGLTPISYRYAVPES